MKCGQQNQKKIFFLFFFLAYLSFFSLSCGEKIIYKDRPVELDKKDKKDQWGDELFLQPGTHKEQLFKKLVDGEDLHIIQGFQGGTWIHLSVRISGMPSVGHIKVTISENVGIIEYDLKLVRSAEGFLEAFDIPIPIKAEGAALEALYGKKVKLEVSFSAKDRKVSAKLNLVLEKG